MKVWVIIGAVVTLLGGLAGLFALNRGKNRYRPAKDYPYQW